VLKARQVLRETADYPEIGRVIFLTPEKIEIPLAFSEGKIPQLAHLDDLRNQFSRQPEKDAADFDLFHGCCQQRVGREVGLAGIQGTVRPGHIGKDNGKGPGKVDLVSGDQPGRIDQQENTDGSEHQAAHDIHRGGSFSLERVDC